jgi:hypothetical protein
MLTFECEICWNWRMKFCYINTLPEWMKHRLAAHSLGSSLVLQKQDYLTSILIVKITVLVLENLRAQCIKFWNWYNYLLNGIVSQELRPSLFWETIPQGPLIRGWIRFEYGFVFAKIFDHKNWLCAMPHSAVSIFILFIFIYFLYWHYAM